MFKHRGLLHSPALWVVIGVFGYIGIGWPFFGLIIPQGVHIATDKFYSEFKSILPKWIWKRLEKVI